MDSGATVPSKKRKASGKKDAFSAYNWEPVDIDTDIFTERGASNELMAGLISLEVAPSSSAVKKTLPAVKSTNPPKRQKISKKKVKKAKLVKSIVETVSLNNEDNENDEINEELSEEKLEEDNKFDIETEELVDVDTTKWEELGLHPTLCKGLGKLGFVQPTPIQLACLPVAIVKWKDIIGAAQTGSGKTLAFGLPILHRLLTLHDSLNKLREESGKSLVKLSKMPLTALIITPTRELALQIVSHLTAVTKSTPVNVIGLVGGMSEHKQGRLLNSSPQIIVATPGRLWELIMQHAFEVLSGPSLAKLRFLVLDEADRMIAGGHFPELDKIIAFIQKHRNREVTIDDDSDLSTEDDAKLSSKAQKRQVFLFSATLSLSAEGREDASKKRKYKSNNNLIDTLAERIGIDSAPAIIDLSVPGKTVSTLTEQYVECLTEDKDSYIYSFLQSNVGKSLVFVNSISCLRRLVAILTILKVRVYGLHAEMQQRQRLKNLDRFKAEDNAIIVCTDVAARGLDIPSVPYVLHYQLPRSSETYIHRIGRTARAGKDGMSVALIGESAADQANWTRINKLLASSSRQLTRYELPAKLLKKIKERLSVAGEIDTEMSTFNKRTNKIDWFSKQALAMDMIVDLDSVGISKPDEETSARHNDKLSLLKQQLDRLLQSGLTETSSHNSFYTRNLHPVETKN